MQHYPLTVENILLTIVITSSLVLIFMELLNMELLNRVIAAFASKDATIQAKDAEIQRLNELVASLEAQLAQSGTQELSNFLSERGF